MEPKSEIQGKIVILIRCVTPLMMGNSNVNSLITLFYERSDISHKILEWSLFIETQTESLLMHKIIKNFTSIRNCLMIISYIFNRRRSTVIEIKFKILRVTILWLKMWDQ